MRDRGRSGNGQHDGRSLEKPGKGDLDDAHAVISGRCFQRILRFQPLAAADRKPRQEPKALLLALRQNFFRFAILNVVLVLDTNDWKNLARPLDFRRAHV